jgi:hypothetical protein
MTIVVTRLACLLSSKPIGGSELMANEIELGSGMHIDANEAMHFNGLNPFEGNHFVVRIRLVGSRLDEPRNSEGNSISKVDS